MKKAILILVIGLFWCNASFAECIEGNCKNGQGTYTWTDGAKYVGEFKDGKWNGEGTFTTSMGTYVGGWKDNNKDGLGTLTWVSGEFAGDKYVGEFKDDKKHGQGIYTWASGSKYAGKFKDGQLYKQGTWTYEDGRVEKGILEKDKLIKFATVKNMMPINKGFNFICYNACKDRNDEAFCRQKCSTI